MAKSSTPLTIVYTHDVIISNKEILEESGYTLIKWEIYLDIREKPEVHLFLGSPFYHWQGPIDKKIINIMTKAERAAIQAAKRAEKAAKKAEKKSKQTTLAL